MNIDLIELDSGEIADPVWNIMASVEHETASKFGVPCSAAVGEIGQERRKDSSVVNKGVGEAPPKSPLRMVEGTIRGQYASALQEE